ncbi:hypothetical protein Tco_0750268 [Tanacetum coccineum]|uniref:Reverse transcriptase domain-containing protein n=1 Tax=Tanacetum coccineum TaxID=301880 RepID=A0ABQ4Z3X2_9ASTR
MRKVLQERGFGSLLSSTETNLRDQVKSISTSVETDTTPIRRMGSSQYAKGSNGLQYLDAYSYEATRLDDTLPQKEKDPGSFTLPCYINDVCFENSLADLRAIVSFMPLSTYLNLGLGELAHTKLTVELTDRTVKYPKGIIENIQVGIGTFVFPVDFIILDMLEDVKVPLILKRPFLSTAHAKIDVFKRKITLRVGDDKIIFKSVKHASSLIKRVYMLSLRERMELDLEARLMDKALIVIRSQDPDFEDFIQLNDLNKPLEHFVVLEDMDDYRDDGMGDVIVGIPFCQKIGVKARRFNGMLTIHNGNDEVTYQMVLSHLRSQTAYPGPRWKEIDNVGEESIV